MSKSAVDESGKCRQMNLAERSRLFNLINLTQGLLARAVETGDAAEVKRLRAELAALVERTE